MTDLRPCCQQVLLDHYQDCSARRDPAGVPAVNVRATRYEVSCLPADHEDASLFTLVVHMCSHGRWAVSRGLIHHDADGLRSAGVRWEDDREPVTSEEVASYRRAYEEWAERFHFDEETALEVARQLAPSMQYPGYTVADALSRTSPDVPGTDLGVTP